VLLLLLLLGMVQLVMAAAMWLQTQVLYQLTLFAGQMLVILLLCKSASLLLLLLLLQCQRPPW
jgi:hypothetical protein